MNQGSQSKIRLEKFPTAGNPSGYSSGEASYGSPPGGRAARVAALTAYRTFRKI